jgi:hypothetical protein
VDDIEVVLIEHHAVIGIAGDRPHLSRLDPSLVVELGYGCEPDARLGGYHLEVAAGVPAASDHANTQLIHLALLFDDADHEPKASHAARGPKLLEAQDLRPLPFLPVLQDFPNGRLDSSVFAIYLPKWGPVL